MTASRGQGGLTQPQVVFAQERQAPAQRPGPGLSMLVLGIVLLVCPGPELTTLLSVQLARQLVGGKQTLLSTMTLKIDQVERWPLPYVASSP